MVLGDHNQAESEGTERQSSVVQVVVHELYDEDTSDCDLALLRLNKSQDFDCSVRPVCLPTDDVVVNMLCIATGWGSTRGIRRPNQWRRDEGAGGAGRTGRHLLGAAKGRKTPKIKKKFT